MSDPSACGEGSMPCRCRISQTLDGSQDHAHPGELTVDPAIAPGGVLLGQPHDDGNGAGRDARSTRAVGVGPAATDQVPVPAEQGLGLDEEPASVPTIEEATQPGEQSSIRRSQGRASHLATEDGHLVTKHDEFDRQLLIASPQHEPDQIEHRTKAR